MISLGRWFTEEEFYQHMDVIEYIHNKWGHFWSKIEDEFSPTVSDKYAGKRWVIALNPDGSRGEMVFGNCITPGITEEDYNLWVKIKQIEVFKCL